MPLAQGTVGPAIGQDGTILPSGSRQGRLGDLIVSELHGRFYEQCYRGGLFSGGMTLTSISAATFSTGTLGATATPIVGVWNPLGSGKNLVILQVRIAPVNTALQTTGAGAIMWATQTSQSGITTGNTPFSRNTLTQAGSVAKDMSGVALTGLSGNLVVRDALAVGSGVVSNLSTLQTAAGLFPPMMAFVENVDGAIIVPPGGVLAALCTTNPPVAISAASSILWEEVQAA